MSPFTFVPAYTLPVYASQWPLPDTTQDSVHGCWLGFAAVAITGNRIPCAYKAQPRTDPSEPNSGTRLLPRVSDGKAHTGPRMKDTRPGEELIR